MRRRGRIACAALLATAALLGWGYLAANLLTLRAIRLLKLFTYELRVIARFSGVRQVRCKPDQSPAFGRHPLI